MIAIPSSANRSWPWSDSNDHTAEDVFQAAYPALHAHLKPFEAQLRRRQSRGRFWWELRSCDYYNAMQRPKLVVQQILYHSVFALDTEAYWANQTVYFLPTDDLYLLAVLNSRIIWWYMHRVWPHKKDEAMSVQKPAVLSLPIPAAPTDLRAQIEALVERAIVLANTPSSTLLDIERELNQCVIQAYGLSAAEVAIIEQTLGPRDPLVVLKEKVSRGRG